MTLTKRGGYAGKQFTNLRVTFQGEKTADGDTNLLTAVLYNPNEDTISLALEKDTYALLDVSYGDEKMATLFEGDVVNAEVDRTPPDCQLTIKLGDGKAAKDVKMTKSWKPGVDFGTIGKDIAQEIKKVKGVIVSDLIGEVLNGADAKAAAQGVAEKGFSMQGGALQKLTELGNDRGLSVSIQDNELVVLPTNGYKGEAILVTPTTGLVGAPKKMRDEQTKKDYIELKMLITSPKIRPHRLIRLESRDLKADLVIRSVKFDGDTHGQNWYATITGVPL